jgi:Flp pilus assembly protein TadG
MLLQALESFRRYFKSESGSILPLAAGLLPVLVGVAGGGVDVGSWVMTKRNLQTAADAAVVAAAWEIANDYENYAEYAAIKEAQENGYKAEGNNELNLTIDNSSGVIVVTASIRQKADVYCHDRRQVGRPDRRQCLPMARLLPVR